MDMLAKIMAYEDDGLPIEEVIELFQELVDTGVVWLLQGSYGRTAQTLIDEGLVTLKPLFEVVAEPPEDHRTKIILNDVPWEAWTTLWPARN